MPSSNVVNSSTSDLAYLPLRGNDEKRENTNTKRGEQPPRSFKQMVNNVRSLEMMSKRLRKTPTALLEDPTYGLGWLDWGQREAMVTEAEKDVVRYAKTDDGKTKITS